MDGKDDFTCNPHYELKETPATPTTYGVSCLNIFEDSTWKYDDP